MVFTWKNDLHTEAGCEQVPAANMIEQALKPQPLDIMAMDEGQRIRPATFP